MIMPKKYFFDRNGLPLAYGKVYTYQAGTTINKETFTTEGGSIANTNPVILNGEGYASIYINGSYNIVVDDLNDNNIWTEDPVSSNIAEEWVDCGLATYLSTTSFKLTGNKTSTYEIGRRIRIDNNVANYSYSTIDSVSFSAGETTITILDSVVLVGILQVCVSIIGVNSRTQGYVLNFPTIEGQADSAIESKILILGDSINSKARKEGGFGSSMWNVVLSSGVTTDGFSVVQCNGVPSLALVLNEAKPLPTMLGAIPNVNDAPTIAINNEVLNAYIVYCQNNKFMQDYRGYTYVYDETLDMTGARNSYAVGDVSDENNVGIYNLVYLGVTIAIDVLGFTHDKLGLAGTFKQTDSINPSAIGVRALESVQHRGSCIRNFDTGYEINGGFYHSFDLGRMNRCRTLWDYSNAPSGIYNSTFNTQNTGFVNGIIANSGDGPVRIGGSWEEWTGRVITTDSGSPQYPIFWDEAYIENYPNTTVAAGLTGNDLDKYTATGIAFSSQSPMKGNAVIVVGGMTTELFRVQNDIDYFDMSVSLFGGVVVPSTALFVLDKCTKLNIDIDYTNSNFDLATIVTGGATLPLSTGSYNNPDGSVSTFDGSSWSTITLLNSWAAGAGARPLSYRVINDVLYIQGFLDGAAATDVAVGIIPPSILSRQTNGSTWFNTSDSLSAGVQGRILNASGTFRIETLGLNGIPINLAIPLKG